MDVIEISCESEGIFVAVHPVTGDTVTLRNPADPYGMNWIREESDWGRVDGFETLGVRVVEGTAIVSARNAADQLELTVEKSVANGRYTELYQVVNTGDVEFFLTREKFGIHCPYNCSYRGRPNVLSDSCVTHVWCGLEGAWLYSAKPDGRGPYLVGMVTEGASANYSIDYDASVARGNASHYRGAIVLHPAECVIAPGETLTLRFVYAFDEARPDTQLIDWNPNSIWVGADRYTLRVGETMRGSLKTVFDWESASIETGGKAVSFQKEGNRAHWESTFSTVGEREFLIRAGGRVTRMRVNVIDDTAEILRRRAKFIVEKQQYRKSTSRLDGAYLIYDRATQRQYFSSSFRDSNAARERLAMGVVVALALQREYDESFAASLHLHRAYLERELFDVETMTVFDGVGRDDRWPRAYNYPWMADFYLEYYHAFNDRVCLEYAAGIMLRYFRMIEYCAQESPCMENLRIIEALQKEGLTTLASQLATAVIRHSDQLLIMGNAIFSEEVSYTQAQFYNKIISLCHAHHLTKERKYLTQALNFLGNSEAFRGEQPDFHTHLQGVRYWDLYWFGKMKSYGDTMPQWLGALCGEMYFQLGTESGNPELFRVGEAILRGALCVYDRNGFGSAGYLMPYRVTIHYPENAVQCGAIPAGTVYGERYDDWANDQDWSLYYAALRNV